MNRYRFAIFFGMIFFAVMAMASDEQKVAVVDGQSIYYKEIAISPAAAKDFFMIQEERYPTAEELSSIIIKKEEDKLLSLIVHVIKDKIVKELKIEIAPEELAEEYTERIEKYQTKKTMREESEKIGQLAGALHSAIDNPSAEREIFTKQLSGQYSYVAWESFRRRFPTHEAVDKLLQSTSQNAGKRQAVERYEKEMLKEMLLQEKINSIIQARADFSEKEILAEFLKRGGSEALFEQDKEAISQNILADLKREFISDWWQQRYRAASIEIFDDRLHDGVLKRLYRKETVR